MHIRADKLRALVVTTTKRSAALPEVPTLDEAGLKGSERDTWSGIPAPVAKPNVAQIKADSERNAKLVKDANVPIQ